MRSKSSRSILCKSSSALLQTWRSVSMNSSRSIRRREEEQWPSYFLRHTVEQIKNKKKNMSTSMMMKMNSKQNQRRQRPVVVEVSEGMAWLDTLTFPMIAVAVATGVTMKLLMMYEDAHKQESIERKARSYPPEMGRVRMLSKEEWDEIQEIRPRTPFESRIARPNARLRTGDPFRWDDIKDWSIDVIVDAFTRVEDSVHHNMRGKR